MLVIIMASFCDSQKDFKGEGKPFYRAMHYSAKRSLAIACCLSVRHM